MSNLAGRLSRLERQPVSDCPECGGGTIRMILDHDAPREEPAPCPKCGRMPFQFTIAITRPDVGEGDE
jgi:hypothetical protein